MIKNIFSPLPRDLSDEVVEDLVRSSSVRIERIVSYGHSSPETGWYDHINIPAHTKHKVLWTDKKKPTIWLGVFYR